MNRSTVRAKMRKLQTRDFFIRCVANIVWAAPKYHQWVEYPWTVKMKERFHQDLPPDVWARLRFETEELDALGAEMPRGFWILPI